MFNTEGHGRTTECTEQLRAGQEEQVREALSLLLRILRVLRSGLRTVVRNKGGARRWTSWPHLCARLRRQAFQLEMVPPVLQALLRGPNARDDEK